MVLLAGLLPEPQINVDVMGIAFAMATLSYMIPLGISGVSAAYEGLGHSGCNRRVAMAYCTAHGGG